MITQHICPRSPKTIHCKNDEVLNITYANYGRSSRGSWCSLSWTSNCETPGSLKIVQETCQGRRSCLLEALDSVFGEHCKHSNRYLKVQYWCDTPASTFLTTSISEEATAASMIPSYSTAITSTGHHRHIETTEPFQTAKHLSATFFVANGTTDFTKTSQNERNTSQSEMEDSSMVETYNDAVSNLSLEVIVGIVVCALVVILLLTTIIMLYRKRCVKKQITREERQNEIYEMEGAVEGGIETTSPGNDSVAADKSMTDNILYGTR